MKSFETLPDPAHTGRVVSKPDPASHLGVYKLGVDMPHNIDIDHKEMKIKSKEKL